MVFIDKKQKSFLVSLVLIRKNGQFIEYLKKAKLNALEGLNLHNCHIIKLQNPLLTMDTKSYLKIKSCGLTYKPYIFCMSGGLFFYFDSPANKRCVLSLC